MPELPDVTIYVERLRDLTVGGLIERVRLASPFLLRTVEPPLADVAGRAVREVRRLGKRVVLGVEGDLFLVLHLMIAGRLRWRAPGAPVPARVGLAAFDFPAGAAVLTEAGTKKRASLHLVAGEAGLAAHDPGGLEVLEADAHAFAAALRRENRTLKRALTDPRLFSGIGNAYSDEILFAARLSPVRLTNSLDEREVERLRAATVETLTRWTDRFRAEVGKGFPEKVTAFRPGMAVHGRHGQPCSACGAPIQRIRYGCRSHLSIHVSI